MLPVQKHKEITQQIHRILRRIEHVQQVKTQQFSYITLVQQLYSNFSQKIHRETLEFEQKIIKNSLYSSQKASNIVNMAKVYKQFSIQMERNSKINVINLQGTKHEQIAKQQQKLQKKCSQFLNQFEQYAEKQKNFNNAYTNYNTLCNHLDQIIKSYRSYQNPVSFYNQTLTNQYLSELQKKYSECHTHQTAIITDIQVLDQNRKWLSQHVKQINEYYVILLHIYLTVIENTINYIVDPTKEQGIEKGKIGLRSSQHQIPQNHQMMQLQRLDNLYASQNGMKNQQDNLFEDFSELFRKSFNPSEINSDYKFFYDRCENVAKKKIKMAQEVCQMQSMAIDQVHRQQQNYYAFQKEYKHIEKKVFTNNGVESFKKKFRKYFGSNFLQIEELCMSLIERQKNHCKKYAKIWRVLLIDKRQNLKNFQKCTGMILEDHLKLKNKTYARGSVDGEQLKSFKASITQSFNQLKKQLDKLILSYVKTLYEAVLKEAITKNLSRLLQKQKTRMDILKTLNIDSQIIMILKEDSSYEMLLNQCPKPNLYQTFQSIINKKQYEDTRNLLIKKQNRLKNMIRSKQACCGIKSEPIKLNIISSHECTILDKDKYGGVLNISASGLIFEETSWNPFKDNLQLMIPQTDIQSFDSKKIQDKQVMQIGTDLGSINFTSKQIDAIIESMQKNITFNPIRQNSQRVNRKNDSSSYINNNSTEFRISYDKTLVSNHDLSKPPSTIIINVNSGKISKNEQAKLKANSIQTQLKKLTQQWKKGNYFSEYFKEVERNPPFKNNDRHDFTYTNGHSKFYLKQRRTVSFQGKDFCLSFQWKISFPDAPMLHSFKHHQKLRLQNIQKQLKIRVIMAKSSEQQLYIKNKFYKEIDEMNNQVCRFIVQFMEREADVVMQAEDDGKVSIDSGNVVLDDVYIEERESKNDNGSRISKLRSSTSYGNGKNSAS